MIRNLRSTPGFNDYLRIGRYTTDILCQHGKKYLSSDVKGVVAFTEYAEQKRLLLEERLANVSNTAAFIHDPTRKCLVHYFIIPADSLHDCAGPGGFSHPFMDFVRNDRTYGRFVPLVHMKLDSQGQVNTMQFTALVDHTFLE